MGDSDLVFQRIKKPEGVSFPVLVPNPKGLQRAIDAGNTFPAKKNLIFLGATEIAIFGSASEAFSQKNINCSIDESFARFTEVFSVFFSSSHFFR
jgi:hydroxymethylglutaryl-CoA lyase